MLPQFAEQELERLARYKRTDAPATAALGPELVAFYKNSVEKRQAKFGKIANYWNALVPPTLAEHCSLESFSRGSLTVLVDSASHLYELKQLLLAGLQQQLLMAAKSSGLQKISLKRGNWCDASQRVEFGPGSRQVEPSFKLPAARKPELPKKPNVRNRRRRDVE
jgi:hypothetical protein